MHDMTSWAETAHFVILWKAFVAWSLQGSEADPWPAQTPASRPGVADVRSVPGIQGESVYWQMIRVVGFWHENLQGLIKSS